MSDLNRGSEIIARFMAQELPDQFQGFLLPEQAHIIKTHLEEIANNFATGVLTITDEEGGKIYRKDIR